MNDILDKFIANAKETTNEGYYNIENKVEVGKVSLKEKLARQEFSLICEIKHASPVGEYTFGNIDAGKTAILFEDAGADAISCVVEPKIFRGNIGNISTAKKGGLPVLFKDFVVDKRQIKAAANSGADAVLLVMKVMDRERLDIGRFIEAAHAHGLEVLLECYNADEMQRAMDTNADVLGINNRNLRTLKVDITTTKKILDEIGEPDRPLISESGIRTAGDAESVKAVGADGILVGTAIWTAADMYAKIKELRLRG